MLNSLFPPQNSSTPPPPTMTAASEDAPRGGGGRGGGAGLRERMSFGIGKRKKGKGFPSINSTPKLQVNKTKNGGRRRQQRQG